MKVLNAGRQLMAGAYSALEALWREAGQAFLLERRMKGLLVKE